MFALRRIGRRIIDKLNQFKIWKFEKSKYLNYCNDSNTYYDSRFKRERDIIVLSHTIEKGLSHKSLKRKFGLEVAFQLLNNLKQYINEDPDHSILENGIAILNKYIEANISIGVDPSELPIVPKDWKTKNPDKVGAYEISANSLFSSSDDSFNELAKARRAVRLYDYKSNVVSFETVREAASIARYSPSACNRQAVRLFFTNNQDKIKQICDIQKGSNGFGKNAGGILIVCSDLRYYTMAERRLPMFDCGLFVMTLVYALFQKHIATCILNGSFTSEQESQINEIMGISPHFLISSVITLNAVNPSNTIMIAKSDRKKVDDILINIE